MGVDADIDITTEDCKTVLALLQRHLPGTTAWVYGSRVKWTSRPQSDLDLVVFATPEQRRQVGDLREAFEESNLPFRVDLFVWDDVPDSFRKQIQEEHVVLVDTGPWDKSDEWVYRRLEDCMESIIDYRGKTPRKTSSGIPLITAKVVKRGRIETPTEFIALDHYASWMRRGMPQSGDVLITTEAPLGEVAQLHRQRVALAQRIILLRGKSRILDNRFLRFLLQSDEVQVQLRARATGTTVLGIKQKELRQIEFSLPPIPEQRAIAQILGTLDDKIELNRRMNATLEAIARVLFRSWFVDFDPVRAKMERRDTGLPQDIADLFPDRLVDSELGEIPVGWEVKPLRDLLDLAYGNALKADSRRHHGNVPVYGSNGQVGWHDRRLVQGPGIVVGRKGNPGIVTWVATDFFPIDTTFYVVPKDNNYTLYFLFFALKGQDLPAIAADSVVPGLNRNLAYMNNQVVPAGQIVEHFNGYVGPLFTRCHRLDVESLALALLRDTLLPRLISGDLRLKDTQTFPQRES